MVVLSYGAWQRRYGGDASVVGRQIEVDGNERTVVGIMPRLFNAPARWIKSNIAMSLWIPYPLGPDASESGRGNRSTSVVGRLSPDVTLEEARAEMEIIHGCLRNAYPQANDAWTIQLIRWHELIVGDVRPALFLLLTTVGLLLLIACANVANLKLNRMLSREGELALRAALGAGRFRLVRQIVTESFLLAVLGTLIGSALAFGGLRLLVALSPGNIPRMNEVEIDVRVLAFTFLITVVTTLVFGMAPALTSIRGNLASKLREGLSRSLTRGRHRAQGAIAVLQLTLSVALLISATLMARSFWHLVSVPTGLNPEKVLTATVVLSWNRVDTMEKRSEFVRATLEELSGLPGVVSAAMINSLPFSGSNSFMRFLIDGQPSSDPNAIPAAAFRGVSPDYFATMAIPLLEGRDFTVFDLERPTTAIINERMAEMYWPGESVLGKRFARWSPDSSVKEDEWLTVIGMVGNVKHRGLDGEVLPEVFQPYTVEGLSSKTFVLKTDGEPALLAPSARQAVAAVDPEQPLRDVRPMTAYISESVANPRFNAAMMVLASAVALALAAVGLFGVVAYSATERAHEIGIRMALGAERRKVLQLILRRGVVLAGIGMVSGLVLSLVLGRALKGFLFGVTATDLTTYVTVSALFFALALLTSGLPALKASRIDPIAALRME